MLKIRRPLGRLIFNMGIAIPGKTVFLIETAPWSNGNHALYDPVHLCQECVSPIHLLCKGAPDLAPVPPRLFSNVITLHWHNVNVNKMPTLLKLRPTNAGDILLTFSLSNRCIQTFHWTRLFPHTLLLYRTTVWYFVISQIGVDRLPQRCFRVFHIEFQTS